MSDDSWKSKISANNILKFGWIVLILSILIISSCSLFFQESFWIGQLAISIGLFISGTGYYCLVSFLPEKAKETDSSVSLTALKASSWLVIAGIILMIIGFLYLMNIIPISF
jgi:hypothetical protein